MNPRAVHSLEKGSSRMKVTDLLATLDGLRGNDLKAAKERVVDQLEADELAAFVRDAPAASLKKLTDLFLRSFFRIPTERAVPLYEATYRHPTPPKSAKAIAMLRTMLVRGVDASTALECVERHPEDSMLVDIVRSSGTVAQLRRAASVGTPGRHVTELLPKLAQTPGELGMPSAEALALLGCTWRPPLAEAVYPNTYRRSTRSSWSREDPDGKLPAPSGGGWLVATRAMCEQRSFLCKLFNWDTEPSPVQWLSGGEVIDVDVQGVRRVLAPIAYAERSQFYFSVDLADPAPNPLIYSVDHDGTGPSYFTDLPGYCYKLRS